MKVKEAVRGIRRYIEAFEALLDYDPYADIRLRIERLEQQVADLNAEDADVSAHQSQRGLLLGPSRH